MRQLKTATQVNKLFIQTFVKPGMKVVDATLGKGNDALYLASLIGPQGHLYGFDIQDQAIKISKEKLADSGVPHDLYLHSHAHMYQKVNTQVDFVIFNLGYLPSFDKSVTTMATSTLAAIEDAFKLLKIQGMIMITVYPGHQEGKNEQALLDQRLQAIDQNLADVLKYEFVNQKNSPPYTYIIEKRLDSEVLL